MKSLLNPSLIVCLLSLNACDRPACTNANPIFEHHPSNSEQYKKELARQLNTFEPSSLSYWLDRYEEKEGQEYLYFHVQGEGLCAQMVLTAEDWKKLSPIIEAKAVSYRGAEFIDLRYELTSASGSTQFVFRDFGRIID